MNLTIHRGTDEIGGSAVEVTEGKTKLLFDFGIPLETMDREDFTLEEYKPLIKGLYKDETPEFQAVFLTHAHPDHFGLLGLVNPEIPIYVTQMTYDILVNVAPLTSKFNTKDLNLKVIDKLVKFDDIEVSAYLVNHSIAGACGYKIKSDDKTIVYTGDIRFHGRSVYKNEKFIKAIKNPDYLIMEGTTLNREEQETVSEDDLEKEFIKEFLKDKLPLVLFTPQNLDRLVTIYRACKRTNKSLVLDPYSCYMLELYSQLSDRIPQFDWDFIRVQFSKSKITDELAKRNIMWKYKKKKIGIDEIRKNPEKFVVKGAYSMNKKIFDTFKKDELNVIFSMWKGYLEKPDKQLDDYKDIIKLIHTSGHAYVKDLQEFTNKVKPKNIIPIHTECKDKYSELFSSNVITLSDGERLEV